MKQKRGIYNLLHTRFQTAIDYTQTKTNQWNLNPMTIPTIPDFTSTDYKKKKNSHKKNLTHHCLKPERVINFFETERFTLTRIQTPQKTHHHEHKRVQNFSTIHRRIFSTQQKKLTGDKNIYETLAEHFETLCRKSESHQLEFGGSRTQVGEPRKLFGESPFHSNGTRFTIGDT
jgi:hypothetical protein